MRQVAVVLELRRGLLPAMGPSLSSYCSIVALKVQKKVWWKLLPRFRPEKTASIKGYTPLISTTGDEQHIERPRLKLALSRKLVLHNFAAALCCTAASLSLQAFGVKNNFHQEEVQDE
ncbi:uncharacterized protein LOC142572911 isoform X1 [Dermacentor variabilis]|uniref:uncharacterized protein LOC142572911 isoform X1 n=1 Tax=Dermacentor variabilis TaxID=34621 RepID=UPI003F5BB724